MDYQELQESHVSCVAFHPTRAAAIIGTRRPYALVREVNVSCTPTQVVGQPIYTTFTPTQIFVTVTDSGADRVIVLLENRCVDVYSWNSGRALLFRHQPRSGTLRDLAIRFAMAELRERTLFLVPLLRLTEKGKKDSDAIPALEQYHAFKSPDQVLTKDGPLRTRPSTKFYTMDVLKRNRDKHLPSVDVKVPIVGMRAHSGGAPLLAVMCADAGLRIYDLQGGKTGDQIVLYNVAALRRACHNLRVPTFSRPGLNGDGRSKLFDILPSSVEQRNVQVKKNKSRLVYTNVHIAVADDRRVVVLDLSMPGTCDEIYSCTAPPRAAFLGVHCDPIGSPRCSGAPGDAEVIDPQDDLIGSRRIIWIITSLGVLTPYTMDDTLSRSTKLLSPVDWIKPIPLLTHTIDESGGEGEGLRVVDKQSAASSHGHATKQATLSVRTPLSVGDGAIVEEWSNSLDTAAQVTGDHSLSEVVLGKLLRVQLLIHPTLPFLSSVSPLDGTWIARRVSTQFLATPTAIGTASCVCAPVQLPSLALTPQLLLGGGATAHGVDPVASLPEFTFAADTRSGVCVLRVLALDATLRAQRDEEQQQQGAASMSASALHQQTQNEAAFVILSIEERGQIAVTGVTAVPLTHLGALPEAAHRPAGATAQFFVVAVQYTVATAQRNLAGVVVAKSHVLLLVVDTSRVSIPASSVQQALPSKQILLTASDSLRFVRVLADCSVGRTAGWLQRPLLPLRWHKTSAKGAKQRTAAATAGLWTVLDWGRMTLQRLSSSQPLSDDMAEIAPQEGALQPNAAYDANTCADFLQEALNNAAAGNFFVAHDAVLLEDTPSLAAAGSGAAGAQPGFAAAARAAEPTKLASVPPLLALYSSTSVAVSLQCRQRPAEPSATVPLLGTKARPLHANQLLAAAATATDDDAVLIALHTADAHLALVYFTPETPDGMRAGRLAWRRKMQVEDCPTTMLFVGPLLVVSNALGVVECYTTGAAEPRRVVGLPTLAMPIAATADRLVAAVVTPRRTALHDGKRVAIEFGRATTAHCPTALFGPLLAANIDLYTRCANVIITAGGTDTTELASIARRCAEHIGGLSCHLGAHATFVPLGIMTTLARYGYGALANDLLKATTSEVVSETGFVFQPARMRHVDGAALQLGATPGAAHLPAAELQPSDRLASWPVPAVDEGMVHAERARQFALNASGSRKAGAVVVAGSVTHTESPTGNTPGMTDAQHALQQVAWMASNERGVVPLDLAVSILAFFPWVSVPPDVAAPVEVWVTGSQAQLMDAYTVACRAYGAASVHVRLFVANVREITDGKLPLLLQEHHANAEFFAEQARAAVAGANSAATKAAELRDVALLAFRARAADVRLGLATSAHLPTISYPVKEDAGAGGPGPGDEEPADERVRLMQSFLTLWPLTGGTVEQERAGEDDGADAATAAPGSVAGASGAVGSSGGSASFDNRSSAGGSARTGMSASIYGGGTTAVVAPLPRAGNASAGYAVGAKQAPAHADPTREELRAEKSEATMAAEQAELRAQFFGGPKHDSDDSSDDGTGGVRVDIKLRDPAAGGSINDDGAAGGHHGQPRQGDNFDPWASDAFNMPPPAPSFGTESTPAAAGRRRLGGGASTVRIESTDDVASPTHPVTAGPRDVDDVMACAFAAFEAKNWTLAQQEFAAVTAALIMSPEDLGDPSRITLIAHYRLATAILVHINRPDVAESQPPSRVLWTLVHALQLRLAGEHLALVTRVALEDVLMLQWPAAAEQLLALHKFAAPEYFDTAEGMELEDRVGALSGDGGDDDALVVTALGSWGLCSGGLVPIDGAGGRTACPTCNLQFSAAFAASAAEALDSQAPPCPYCGVGILPL